MAESETSTETTAPEKAELRPPEPLAQAGGTGRPPEPPERLQASEPPGRERASSKAKIASIPAPAPASVPPTAAASVPPMPARASVPPQRPSEPRPLAAYELLARSARLADLVALTKRIVGDAARARSLPWRFETQVAEAAEEARLTREDADTPFGNALDVLGKGHHGPAERALAAALWAHAVAESPRSRAEDEDRLASDIVWLATHTAFDATPLLDRALGEESSEVWTAIAALVRRGRLERGEALVASAALAASATERAKALTNDLGAEVKDAALLRVLGTGALPVPDEVRLEGEIAPAPRGPIATTILAFTGILFALHAVRLLMRLALAYRRPAEVLLSDTGVRVKTRTELLGRTLREREHVILKSGLVRVIREVRFPRAAFYAGLLALAVGSYVGVRSFVDGVRAASPSLLLVGLAIVALGIAADFVLGSLVPGSRGACRIAFVPRKGPVLCVGDVDLRRADEAIARSIARR